MAAPLVSIGLPVRNREGLVGVAIESVLRQSLGDFELIICDNDSSDRTGQICEEYARKDRRIRYYRNLTDIGISYNHNRTFEVATGKYFHWMGSDDSHDPRFLERCVAVLEANPDRALCHTAVKVIDEHGDEMVTRDNRLDGTDSSNPVERFAAILFGDRWCWSIYGLFRSNVLRKTTLIGNFRGGDRDQLAQVALQGRFIYLPEPLFYNRHHSGRFTFNQDQWRAWHFRATPQARLGLPLLVAHRRYVAAIRRHLPQARDRWRCYAHLARWWLLPETVKMMSFDLIDFASPTLGAHGRALKRRLFGRRPPFEEIKSGVTTAPE
jgi:glycosyltransferase involved in cell wall biosynthesis